MRATRITSTQTREIPLIGGGILPQIPTRRLGISLSSSCIHTTRERGQRKFYGNMFKITIHVLR